MSTTHHVADKMSRHNDIFFLRQVHVQEEIIQTSKYYVNIETIPRLIHSKSVKRFKSDLQIFTQQIDHFTR